MRYSFAGLFILMVMVIAACISVSRRSDRKIGGAVSMLLAMLIPPIIGNLIIILASTKDTAMIGCYIYFIGMDAVIMALMHFSFCYCVITWPNRFLQYSVYGLITLDVVQLLLNPVFGHAFDTEPILVSGFDYYRLIPYWGQTFHRVVVYGLFSVVLLIFVVKIIRAPRVYVERYSIILAAMMLTGLWQTYYIFSRTPVDRSMAGYGVFGLLIFYFSLYYRPLTLLDRLLANMASEMPDAIFFYDVFGRCIWANRPAIDLVGIKDEKFDSASKLLTAKFGKEPRMKDPEWTGTKVLGSGQDARYYYHSKRMVTDEKGKDTGFFLSIRDVTSEQRALQQERYNATHDSLTGLFTKEYLYESIRKKLDANPDEDYLILYIDIVDFKIINDIFGSTFGDRTLRQIAIILRHDLSGKALFGRLGGDTFGVLMEKSRFDAARLESQLSRFSVKDGDTDRQILVHLGVYEVTERELDVPFMFDRALLAKMTIEDEYQTHIAFYDEKIRSEVLWAQHISAQLHDALKKRHVIPYLQPIVDQKGKIVGAEALARWIHPEDGFLPPSSFIPIFEKNGMITEVDRYMWRCACEILSGWKEQGRDLFVSVNISPKDFYFMDVAQELKDLVNEYGVDSGKLRIEITETVMMTDVEKRMKILEDLRQAGFVVEMDDFGSGYSSLNLLKDMPVDVLKIDMKFLSKTTDEKKARTILQNILNLSEDLGIFSLTEGVETHIQHRMLSEMGCKLFQGFFFAKPLPITEFEDFYQKNRAG